MVVKELKGTKAKQGQEIDPEESSTSIAEELSVIFSTANFLQFTETRNNSVKTEEDDELEIGIWHPYSPFVYYLKHIYVHISIFSICKMISTSKILKRNLEDQTLLF